MIKKTVPIPQELRILAESIMRQKMKGILAFVRDNIFSHQFAVLVLLYDKEKHRL
jgi:hypothetical protein